MKEIIDLKAKAYDLIGMIEYNQKQLNEINMQISKKIKEYNEALKKTEDGQQLEPIN
jgi:hypothetical protein